MLFNSYSFVLLYAPICLCLFYLSRWIAREKESLEWLPKTVLVLLSFWFYGFLDIRNVPILICSMAVNYGFLKICDRKSGLTVGIAFNLVTLFFFKYTDSLFVPLGISFYTFTQIALLMDGYRGNVTQLSLLDYSLYVSFFPKLLEGPITLPTDFLPQIKKACKEKAQSEELYKGIVLFILGLAKKVLLADVFGSAADFGYNNLTGLNSIDALLVMLAYTLQIYFDFSGYCDMAMGIARCLSFKLPLNFDSPYRAGNIIEFWKGWHITLTKFFTKYLYIPLGGNRKGRARTYLNTFLIFFVSGIWHGAGLTFIVWGMLHGILYVITRWFQDQKAGKKERVSSCIRVFLTFLYVNIAWIFFRAPSIRDALTLLKTMCSMKVSRVNWNLAGCFNMDEFWYVIKVLHLDRYTMGHYILLILYFLVALGIVFFGKKAVDLAEKIKPSAWNMIVLAGIFVWCLISFSGVSSFIYLNF